MKLVASIIAFVLIGLLSVFAVLGVKSRSGSPAGLVNDKLSHCPQRPNCICSEFADDTDHYSAPITVDGMSKQQLHTAIVAILKAMNGSIIVDEENYIAATFQSRTFKFMDDFEIRLDHEQQQLHIRSASRVGFSDQGVNRKRVEKFKKVFSTSTVDSYDQ